MYDPKRKSLLKEIMINVEGSIDLDFQIRLSSNFDRIHGLLEKLYPQSSIKDLMIPLVDRMVSAYSTRPERLRRIDLDREKDPQWYLSENLVGMMLYVDRFCGDLKTFQKKIDYFQDLGINVIHLMPLMKCPPENNDGGYAVSDFRQVSPDLGTMKDINQISELLHENGINLMLDFAVNHTSNEHEWATAALKGEKSYQEYYYTYESRDIPDQYEQSLPQVFPETSPGNFTYYPEMGKWVMTVFHEYQWDLNYTNPAVFIEMLDNLLFLANQGIDIVRLDALAFMWKRIGTESQNLEEAHLIVQLFKACTQVVTPGTLFLAEAIVAPNEILKYFGEPQVGIYECELAYNATLMTLLWDAIATKNNRLLNVSFDNIPQKPLGSTWLNYIRCHDDIGLGYEDLHAGWAGYDPPSHRSFLIQFLTGELDWSFSKGARFMENRKNGDSRISGALASLAGLEKALADNDEATITMAIDRIVMLHAIIISYGGIPLLYMGDEIGMTNDYSYLKDKSKKEDNRWMHRPEMDWEKLKIKNQSGTSEQRIYSRIKHLIKLRKSSPEFADYNDSYRIDCRNEHLFGYIRQRERYRSLCVFNLNDHPEPLYKDVLEFHSFDLHKGLVDRITDKKLDFDHFNYLMKPYQALWISQG